MYVITSTILNSKQQNHHVQYLVKPGKCIDRSYIQNSVLGKYQCSCIVWHDYWCKHNTLIMITCAVIQELAHGESMQKAHDLWVFNAQLTAGLTTELTGELSALVCSFTYRFFHYLSVHLLMDSWSITRCRFLIVSLIMAPRGHTRVLGLFLLKNKSYPFYYPLAMDCRYLVLLISCQHAERYLLRCFSKSLNR